MSAARVVVDVWSDYVCPFCYLQEPVLEAVSKQYGNAIEVRWHAFELRPEPVPTLDPGGEYLRNIWARSVYPMAAQRGMTLRLPPVQPRSRRAFEAAEFARSVGRFDAMHDALFRAFFQDGKDLASDDVLVEIASSIGVDGAGLRDALERGAFSATVLEDRGAALRLSVSGVPAMVVRGSGAPLSQGRALVGAQPVAAVAAAIAANLRA